MYFDPLLHIKLAQAITERETQHAEEVSNLLEKLMTVKRINEDLKQALREVMAKPAVGDLILIEAFVRGVAEEPSIGGGRHA